MSELAFSKCYNSSITVDAEGEVIANYRKSFLDNWDKIWASEGLDGFFAKEIQGLGKVAIGIGKLLRCHSIWNPTNRYRHGSQVRKSIISK